MKKTILVDARYPRHMRAALIDENKSIEEFEWEMPEPQIRGNIYLAKVSRIEPALQAVFITYENGKSGFMPFSEIHPDLFILPGNKEEGVSHEIPLPPASEDIDSAEQVKENAPSDNIEELEKKAFDEDAIKIDFETLTDEIESVRERYQNMYKKYKVQDVIKKDQILLVQAIKEPKGNKAAFFSTFISLAGKFCVLMANTPEQHGVSRRIVSSEERKRLKDIIHTILEEVDDQKFSLTIRTAGVDRSLEEIKKDYEYLARMWNKINQTVTKSKAPCIVHTEECMISKIIRDMFDDRVQELVIEGHKQYKQALYFFEQILPSAASKIIEHKSNEPIFSAYGVEEQVMGLYQPIVPLPSGGYIVINPTEALTSIDVNSGKSIHEKNIEETALKTNIEAAIIVAKHLRLREIGGLVVVDFIDMQEAKNRRIIEQVFKEALSSDRARIQVNSISHLGLMELSRQRLKPSFLESHSAMCKYCSGKGLVRSQESNSIVMLRTIAKELSDEGADVINAFAHIDSISYIFNKKRKEIESLENQFGIELNLYEDHNATAESFSIEKISYKGKRSPKLEIVTDNEEASKLTEEIKAKPIRKKQGSFKGRSKRKINKTAVAG